MATLTGKQAGKLIALFANTPSEQVQDLFASGLLADVRDANVAQVNRDEFRWILGLKPLATSMLNLAEFFKTRGSFWVSPWFTEQILAPAIKMVETTRAPVGKPFDLSRNMTDTEIRKELGDNHTFDAYEFLLYLRGALELQWGGRDGELLNSGYANIFYVRGLDGEVFAVNICWRADSRGWEVHARQLGGSRWGVGHCAFPRMSSKTPTSAKKEEDRNLPRRGEIRTFLP